VSARIELTVENGLAEVRLNRPEKLNALDFEMFDALVETGATLEATSGLRAVVLLGAGRSFSVGIDLGALGAAGGEALARLEARTYGDCNLFQQSVMQWRRMPAPVIAAIQGHALGGGLQLALGADIRIVAPDARLSIREMAWGLVPDMGGMVLLLFLNTSLAQGAFEAALKWSQERMAFGHPIAQFQAIQFMLADMATEIDAARLLVRKAAWKQDSGSRFSLEASTAKLFASEMATRVAHKAIQIHGGYGYSREYPVERAYRDARITEIYEGTSEIQRLVIAAWVLKS